MAWTQLTFTCSKSSIETLEKDLKYVQIQQERHHVNDVVLVPLLLIGTYFTPSNVSVIDFEQVNLRWKMGKHEGW